MTTVRNIPPLAIADDGEVSFTPVHLTVETDEELQAVFQQSEELVECSTVLREWGMKFVS